MRVVLKQYRRFFKRSPLATSLASIVLAVGFAGSALACTIMLALSSPIPHGLRSIQYATVAAETGGGGSQSITWKIYQRLRETAGWSDPALVAYAEPISVKLYYNKTDLSISVAAVSRGFFTGFTEGLAVGEDFSSSSETESEQGERQVILSRRLAERLFSIPSDALGREVVLKNQTFRVIGVAPGRFSGLWSATDAWVAPSKIVSLMLGAFPAGREPKPEVWQNISFFYALAGSGNASLERLRNELGGLIRSPDILPLHLHVSDGLSKDPIWDMKIRFWARLAFLLSISLIFAAGLNYCGLLLAQAPRYVEEVRLKRVLGASVPRILFENMCGPVLTVLVGFLIAASVATAAIWALSKQRPYLLPLGRTSWQTLFTILGIELAIAFLLAIVIALVPSMRLLWDSGTPHMGYTTTTSRKAKFALYAIVSSQMASCILVCVIAVMIIGAVRSVSKVALGFDSNHLIAVQMGAASKGATIEFSTAGEGEFPFATFTRQVIESSQEKLRNTQYTSAASCAPLAPRMKTISIERLDRDVPPRSIHLCAVSQGFFQTMGNPILEGSGFSTNRFTGAASEVVINRRLADELWPGENPLHHSVRVEEPAWGLRYDAEVVGIAQDMRLSGLTSTPDATVFLPLKGNVFSLAFPLYFLAKDTEPSKSFEELVQQQAAIYMPSLGVSNSYRVDEQLQQSFIEQKARVWFIAIGAALVAMIAYTGLYGVLIHAVNSKRKEMAIRACFGASTGDLRKIIIRQAIECSAAAIAISLLAWKPMMILVSSAWLGKVELSWQSAVIISFLCLATAVGISLFPASAAARVSLAEILKDQ